MADGAASGPDDAAAAPEFLPRLFYRLLGDVRDVVFVAAAGAGGPVSGLADWRDMAGAGRVSGSPISQLALHGTDRSL